MFVHLALSLGLLLISNAVSSQSSSVLTVSPGGLQESRQIADACPTFSWGRATGANRYKVAIFDAMESDSPDYAQQWAITDPVLQASIEAPALSWTPAADQCLEQGGSYLWFVQAITSDGSSDWSAGRLFEVNLEDSALAETVRQEVSFQLRDPAIWNQVLYDVMSKGSPIVAWGRQQRRGCGKRALNLHRL